jgi:hypothetical protein
MYNISTRTFITYSTFTAVTQLCIEELSAMAVCTRPQDLVGSVVDW